MKDHELKVQISKEIKAFCSCGDWEMNGRFLGDEEYAKRTIEEGFKRHLATLEENTKKPWNINSVRSKKML